MRNDSGMFWAGLAGTFIGSLIGAAITYFAFLPFVHFINHL